MADNMTFATQNVRDTEIVHAKQRHAITLPNDN